MPAELPGYRFDAVTNRYYKIQANHVAPAGSNYSRQAVNAEKAIESTQRHQESSRLSKHASTVARAKALQNPLLSFDRRLGNLRTSAQAYIREYYAASLSGADAFSGPMSMPQILGDEYKPAGLSDQFAIEETDGSLLTALSYKARGSRALSLLLAFDRGKKSSDVVEDYSFSQGTAPDNLDHDGNWPSSSPSPSPSDVGGYLYSPHHKRILQSAPKVDCMLWAGPGLVCWSHETQHGGGGQEAMGMGMGMPYQSDLTLSHCSAPGRAIGLDLMVRFRFQARVLDLATSPSRTSLAIATSNGVSVMTDLEYGQEVVSTAIRGEQMKVGFKDENVLMSGSRSGRLMFCDTRSVATATASNPQSSLNSESATAALRIQHSSAISGIAALPDGNRILVNGLTDMKIYDLRFAAAPALNRTRLPRERHHRYHRVYTPSTPVVTFNVDPTRRQNRYGLGFAYDPELDLVVSASTDNYHNHRVGVWSAQSGQMLDSPLNSHAFREPVTCAKVVRVRDGPKSVLLASAGKIHEWCVQGRGFEWEQE
ncbi:hypothetical protein A1O1_02366 [Capronia coronata CBS 617.96]|uniref:Myocyte-specific enhancer factor 2d n=1 Tax=Capronia coronata CBS 617.96 TaxID=1182541 RepID=W9YN56_9EURO|nr:uncharacterized protein A1O1_02366 [Capronia coronata CBS 617.96]EXJ93973.1 hypothetical protein A1O1_02366 [Capronia coronata CBS 617.96]